MLRSSGAREVHVRISSPPTTGPCHYGIDTPTREELIAAQKTVEEIRQHIGADSIGYLSVEGLRKAAEGLKGGFCDACFSGEYPVPVDEEDVPPQLSLFREVEVPKNQ
jgi:amidophosphoribosyltransferase